MRINFQNIDNQSPPKEIHFAVYQIHLPNPSVFSLPLPQINVIETDGDKYEKQFFFALWRREM